MKSRWRLRRSLQASITLLFAQSSLVHAVSLTGCSTLNTGEFGGSSSTNMYMSNGKCSDTCQGYAFAITQDTNCWCSNYAPGTSTSVGDCSSPCPGYPYELCGNQGQGLFGYIALGIAPIGTQGGSSSSQSPPSSSPSSYSAPSTVETTSVVVSTAVVEPPTSALTVVKTTTASHTPSSTSSPSMVMSTALVTVSGAVVTQVVTTTPTAPASDNRLPQPTRNGLSDGAVAGATIGAILGAGLVGALVFFIYGRTKRGTSRDSEGGISRNTSVLSRTGLLGSARSEAGDDATSGTATLPTLPRLQTANQPLGFDPGSAATGDSSLMSEYKRFSRPLFVDSRLNPNAIMQHPNLSRTSIGTLQDNQDYSRPLEVRNPDQ